MVTGGRSIKLIAFSEKEIGGLYVKAMYCHLWENILLEAKANKNYCHEGIYRALKHCLPLIL